MRNLTTYTRGLAVLLLIALGSTMAPVAQAASTKRVTFRPVLVKSASNPTLTGNISQLSLFTEAADKIWKQAGIDVVALPPRTLVNDAYVNLLTGFGARTISALSCDFIGGPGCSTAAGNGISISEAMDDPMTINVWFVATIGGGSTIAGTSMENGPGQTMNGVAIANSATTRGAVGALAHEIGHVLGLSHGSAYSDINNLMEGSSKIHTSSLSNIYPDGLCKYQLNAGQTATATSSPFAITIPVLDSATAKAIATVDGATGLRVTGLLAATDGSGGTQDQIGFISDALASALEGKPVGIHFQAYDYVQGAVANVRSKESFDKATQLIHRTVPRLAPGTVLTVSVSLEDSKTRKYKPSWTTFRTDLTVSKFWLNVETNNPTFIANWQANVATPFKEWSDEILAWAVDSGFDSQLHLEFCPIVDDTATSDAAYMKLVEWTKAVGLNPAITTFRSTVPKTALNLGKADGIDRVELHNIFNSYKQVDYTWLDANLDAGDRVSNERVEMTLQAWEVLQLDCLARKASAYLWAGQFGDPVGSSLPPSLRGPLTGLDDAFKARLTRIIANRGGF